MFPYFENIFPCIAITGDLIWWATLVVYRGYGPIVGPDYYAPPYYIKQALAVSVPYDSKRDLE